MMELGLGGLFLTAFLAATLLPLGAETLLVAMALGEWSTPALWGVATLGNTLGGLTGYGLGRLGDPRWITRLLRMQPAQAARRLAWVERHGAWAALLCWLPVVGDPLTLALGLARAPWLPVTLLMGLGKAARYGVLLVIVRGL